MEVNEPFTAREYERLYWFLSHLCDTLINGSERWKSVVKVRRLLEALVSENHGEDVSRGFPNNYA